MIYHSFVPSPPLSEYVERFWYCSDVPSHRRVKILPSGALELVINLSEDEIRIYESLQSDRCARFPGTVMSGPYRGCLAIDPMARSTIMGAHFKPGGAARFLGTPVDELANQHVALESLWQRTALELRDRLCDAATNGQRFNLLAQALMTRLYCAPARHQAVPIALATFDRADGRVPVHEVSRRVGLSQRRFIEVFRAEVGMTPKLYCRLRRFQKARRLIRGKEALDWAGVAAACGYCDQSHLIRDFQAFTGLSPTSFLRESNGLCGRVVPNHRGRSGGSIFSNTDPASPLYDPDDGDAGLTIRPKRH